MSPSLVQDAIVIGAALLLSAFLYLRQGEQANLNPKHGGAANSLTGSLPDPDPLYDFKLDTATTRNHVYVNKTIRLPYFQSMSHQPMHINDWIEVDKDLKWYIDEKARVIREQGKKVIDSLPENDAACEELLEILVDYLPKRYPSLFEKLDCKGGGIWNKVTDEKITGLKGKAGVGALLVISRLIEDDFLMAQEREDGHIYCTGGLVAFPGFYLLSEKIDRPLNQVHAPVPQFNKNLLLSVERTLKRFKPDEPFERTSWQIVDDRDLFRHYMYRMPKGEKLTAELHPKDLFLRVDHQTFRKLPRTKVIAFGVHPIMKRLEDLADSPLIPALLAKVHEEAGEDLMTYKLASLYKERMMPYLCELTEKQIEKGLICSDENVSAFRELSNICKRGAYPNTQTSLANPTESEITIRYQAQH